MNTTNSQPTAAQIADELSAAEIEALKFWLRADAHYCSTPIDEKLENKGLIKFGWSSGRTLTELGKQALAVLEARTSAPVAGKPSTITAEMFYREYYAEKINRGECDVWWEEDHSKVAYLRKMNVSPTLYEVYFVGEGGTFANVYPEREFTVTWLTAPQPATAQAANETVAGSGADEPQTQAELCEREIVKIRSLTLHDDEYTGDLLAYAVGSPVGITMCVEARMKQIADLQEEIKRLKKQIKKLNRKSNLDDGFIDYLTQESEE